MSESSSGSQVLPLPTSTEASEDMPPSPSLHENASWLSRVLVLWLSPLLALGYRRPLEARDLPTLSAIFCSSNLYGKLIRAWSVRKQEGSGQYRFLKACLDAFGVPFYVAGFLKLIGDIGGLSSPIILSIIISDLKASGSANIYRGLCLCVAIFSLQMLNTLAVNTYFSFTMQTGMKVRAASAAVVYNKAMRLSGKARQRFSTGQIVNLMSTDCSRLDMAATYIHYVWSGPFQVLIIMVLLFRLLSWAAFIGFGFLLLIIPVQSKVTALLSKYRKVQSFIYLV